MERKGNQRVLSLLALRRSSLIGPRSKVCLHDECYAPRGMDSSYFGLFFIIRDYFLKYGNVALF